MRTLLTVSFLGSCTPDDTPADPATLFSAASPTEAVAISASGNAVAILETAVVAADGTVLHVVDLETRRSEATPLQATVTSETPVVIADDGSLLAWSAGDLTLWDGAEPTLIASGVDAFDASWDLTRAIVERDVPDDLPAEVYDLVEDTSFQGFSLGRDPVRVCLQPGNDLVPGSSQVSGPDGVVLALSCDVQGNGASAFSWRALGLLNVHAPGYERQIEIGGGSFGSTWLDDTLAYVHDGKTHVLETTTDTLTVHDITGIAVAHHDGILYVIDDNGTVVRGSDAEFLGVSAGPPELVVATATGVAVIELTGGLRRVVVRNAEADETVEVTDAQQLHIAGDTVYVLTSTAELLRIDGGTAVPVQDTVTDIWSDGETVVWAYTQDTETVLASEGWSEPFEFTPTVFLVPGGALVSGYREGRFRTFLRR